MREELIIKYLDQMLSDDDALAFEKLCKADPSVIEELNQIKSIDMVFKHVDFTAFPSGELTGKLQHRLTPVINIPLVDINQEDSLISMFKDLFIPITTGILALISLYFIPAKASTFGMDYFNETTGYYLSLIALCGTGLFILDMLLQKKYKSLGSLMFCG